ncbi:MAG TPA: hypothetical protein P5533_06415 [Candidatus Cloacimonadota bacterium]|nr:hypothetical protein [Candidatus Cloacimonadota bacterium]
MIFGEGYLRVSYEGVNVDLIYSYGDLGWKDEYVEVQVLNGDLVRFYDGSRAKIKAVINNFLGEGTAILQLMNMLNSARQANAGVMVYPRWQNAGSRGYLCHVPADFNPERLGLVAAGQKISLAFESISRVAGVPGYDENSLMQVPWTTHTGAQLTDHLGNGLEFRT